MGKALQSQESTISLENSDPGCMKGIFHHFNNRRWNNVKRRLPYKRHSAGKLPAVVGDSGNDSNSTRDPGEEQQKPDARTTNSTAKLSEPGSGHKGSMRSRIKALIIEEVSKRRGRHHRSSSLPSPILERTPIHHLEASNQDPCATVQLEDERLAYQDNVHTSVFSLLDPLLPNISDKSITNRKACDLCAAMLATKYLRQSEVNEHGKHPVKDHILLEDRLMYAIEPSKSASLQESKLFLDALDLLDIRKELFLKVLQDPNSSLCHHLHGHKASIKRLALRKSLSFPTPHSSGKSVPMLNINSSKNKKEVGSSTEGENSMQVGNGVRASDVLASINELSRHPTTATGHFDYDEAPKQLFMRPEFQDNLTLGSPQSFQDQQNNELVLKHFKCLREKLKHAIQESKKERHRIVMDAILHKVPYGCKYRKNVKEDGNMHAGNATEKGFSHRSGCRSDCAFGKSRLQQFRRTSSFNGSCERYNRLLELCSNREANHGIADSFRLRTGSPSPADSSPKLLERILSLPDLRSYSFSRIEGSLTDCSLVSPIRPVLTHIPSIGSRKFGHQKATSLENQIQSTASSDIGSQEKFLEGSDAFKDTSELERGEGIPHRDRFIEPTVDSVYISTSESDADGKGSAKLSTAQGSELTTHDLNLHEKVALSNLHLELSTDYPTSAETNVAISKVETPIYSKQLHFQVDKRNEAEFNIVKDVLERSGFSRNEFLGRWHSVRQPVDPSVFKEVDFQGYEESGSCYQRLLFDLINGVLLDIYDRSFSYWPIPLTCRSHIHPMPIGYHVLEEVWENIGWYLASMPELDPSLDDGVSRDLAKDDGWMNIQFEAECVGLELEDMIFDDVLEELVLP